MSKTKLAVLVFAVAFGVNIAAFLLSRKTLEVEEAKSAWLYELPGSASPNDSAVTLAYGPHQGIIGTLFMPTPLESEASPELYLADRWSFDQKAQKLSLFLKPGLTFQNGDPIEASHFVLSHTWVLENAPALKLLANWSDYLNSTVHAEGLTLTFSFAKGSSQNEESLRKFFMQVLSHPLTGAMHPSNLALMRANAKIGKEWISSGPYKVRKWQAKEITLVSRSEFLLGLPAPFFRTLKFQSAPIKNPSCDFILGQKHEAQTLTEHTVQSLDAKAHVFWLCRSLTDGICKDQNVREAISKALGSGALPDSLKGALQGKQIRYRIPTGSDSFRNDIRSKIEKNLSELGATVKETSYFFQASSDTDLELLFTVVPKGPDEGPLAVNLARLSSRIDPASRNLPFILGELSSFPVEIFMKHMKGSLFKKAFIEPDLDEKKLPL